MTNISYVFFGSATFSIYVLDELEKAGLVPALIVTAPDKPAGRGLVVMPNQVKIWANERDIPVLTPAKLDAAFVESFKIFKEKIPCCIVAAYGKIIPQAVLNIPSHGMLNVHPSLLPRYRGATPIQSAMLDDMKDTGVTVMRIDERMDHGPIVAHKAVTVDEWPIYEKLEETLAREGGRLLAVTLPGWLAGNVEEKKQDDAVATYTKKIVKEDGLITLDMKAFAQEPATIPLKTQYEIFRKIQAYHLWPTAYFFLGKNGKKIRVKIIAACWHDNRLIIERVVAEGKKETDFSLLIHGNV